MNKASGAHVYAALRGGEGGGGEGGGGEGGGRRSMCASKRRCTPTESARAHAFKLAGVRGPLSRMSVHTRKRNEMCCIAWQVAHGAVE